MAEHEGYFNIKEKEVLDVGLQLLLRETALSGTTYRDAVSDFEGKEDDTQTIRVDAYGVAGKRGIRTNDARNRSKLKERKVDVKLRDELYHDVELTDADLTLDLRGVTRRVIVPSVRAIIEGFEGEVADRMHNPGSIGYARTIELTASDLDDDGRLPTDFLFDGRTHLNNASVPQSNRFVVLGSGLENLLLKGKELKDASQAGDNNALRRASVGAVAGFDNIFVSNFIHPYKGFAYHRTGYALVSRAALVPPGVAWGAAESSDGFAVRVMQHLVPNENGVPINVVFHDSWVGSNIVHDHGDFDAFGKFIPSTDPDLENLTDAKFVRAVEIDATALSSLPAEDDDDDDTGE